MPRKQSLGFPSIKEARAAIRAIVGSSDNPRYEVNEEFFHPLLQRLFVEQPYWCDPPGPICTKFKWTSHTLPYGATTDWWFMAYCDEPGWKKLGASGWKGVSWKKAVELYKFDIIEELKQVANARISVITGKYRDLHPMCEHDGCQQIADHVHHHGLARQQIISEAIAGLSEHDLVEIKHQYDWFSDAQFMLPDDHKFMWSIIVQHTSGSLRSFCRKHHNDAHGHQTHQLELPLK